MRTWTRPIDNPTREDLEAAAVLEGLTVDEQELEEELLRAEAQYYAEYQKREHERQLQEWLNERYDRY